MSVCLLIAAVAGERLMVTTGEQSVNKQRILVINQEWVEVFTLQVLSR